MGLVGKWDLAARTATNKSRSASSMDGISAGSFSEVSSPAPKAVRRRGDLARRVVSPGQRLLYFHAVLGTGELWSGSPASALGQFDQAEDAADVRGWDEPWLRWWRPEQVEALLGVGRTDEASALVDAWETMAEPLGRGRVLAHALRCRGLIAASRGALSSAVELLERAAMQHAEVGDPFGRARALLALGAVRRRVRQKRTARAALDGALAEFVALGATSWATTARAELARIGGRERISGLSPSEQRIALCVAEGLTNREIASSLFLGERTVAGHLTRIYSKLGVRSRTELALRLHPSVPESSQDSGKVETY